MVWLFLVEAKLPVAYDVGGGTIGWMLVWRHTPWGSLAMLEISGTTILQHPQVE